MTMIFLQLGMVSVYARRSSPNKVMKLPRDKSISISWSSWLSTLPFLTVVTPQLGMLINNVQLMTLFQAAQQWRLNYATG